MKNQEVANLLYDIADILEIQGVEWRPMAYRKAARSIEGMSKDIEDLWNKGKLEDITGVGEHLAKKIDEYLKTGKLKYVNKIKKKLPKHIYELMDVQGLGPKKIKVLYKKLKIGSLKDLKRAAKKGKIRKLEGFGEKSEQDILRGMELMKASRERMLLGYALPIAENIESSLKKLKQVNNVVVCGSIRRRKETIGDVDILITSKKPRPVMDFFTNMPEVKNILVKGTTKSTVVLKSGLQVDLRVVEPDSFGAAMQYFTGNIDHNVKTRGIAIRKGLKLSEYGVFKKKGSKKVAGKTEEQVYKKLGMQFIPPEMRENRGEIELALKKKVPSIIPYGCIKGEFHMHTKASDGSNTIDEMVMAAKKLGYKYLGISDHSKSLRVANGLNERRLDKHIKAIKKADKKHSGIKVLAGSEVEILKNGKLDYSNKTLEKLDYVIGAVHSGWKSTQAQMTKRILKALSNERLTILAHPTGRLINRRDPFDVDLEEVFRTAKANNQLVEINGSPERLDLNDVHIMMASKIKNDFVISTDAHSTDQLKNIELGIAMARRGWLKKAQIINTFPFSKFKKYL